jgi:hypothetical protein
MSDRTPIPRTTRTEMLLRNRHSCCVCGRGDVQIHHINGGNSDNREDNLAVLCLSHHDEATAPRGLTARLTAEQIRIYKRKWEEDCAKRIDRVVRSRTAFYMVDYKNAERIRQLYSQLSAEELRRAYETLRLQFREEDELREAQGFKFCTEPNTEWNSQTQGFVELIKLGDPHPPFFKWMEGHPADPLFPMGFQRDIHTSAYYDLWCQIMVRAILTARSAYDLEDLAKMLEPEDSNLAGRLVVFKGLVRGRVAIPEEWREKPLSKITLTVKSGLHQWKTTLNLKTHYVYSMTASLALKRGVENGLLLFRSIDGVRQKGRNTVVDFSCTPLMVGNGTLEIPDPRTSFRN